MRGGVLLAVACAFVLSAAGPVVGTSAVPDPSAGSDMPYLTVVADPAFPTWNDTVVLDVRSYVGSNLTDASSGPWVWARWGPPDSVRPINFTRVGVGHYRGNMTVAPTLYDPLRAAVGARQFFVVANVSGESAASLVSLPWFHEGAWVRAYLNRSYVQSGDRLRLIAEVLNGSQRVDADSVTLHLYRRNPSLDQDFHATRVALGVYQVLLRVPDYDPFNESIAMTVSAVYLGVPLSRDVWVAQPGYQTWYHQTSADAVASRGDLWVADALGRPAAGVPVNLTLSNGAVSYVNATTDASGRVPLTLPYGSEHGLFLTVHVGYGSWSSGSIFTLYPAGDTWKSVLPVDPPWMPGGEARDYLLPGDTAVRRFLAVDYDAENAAVPQPGVDVGYSVISGNGLVASGRVRTDSDGRFTVSFTVPETDVWVLFFRENRTPDSVGYQVASPLLGMKVAPLRLGDVTTVDTSAEGNLQRMSELWGSYARVEVLSPSLEDSWVMWLPMHEAGVGLAAGPDDVTGDLRLPSFLPSDRRYAVSTGVSLMYSYTHQFAILGVGEAAEVPIGGRPSPESPSPWTTLGVVAAVATVAAVVVAVSVVALRRRRSRIPPDR